MSAFRIQNFDDYDLYFDADVIFDIYPPQITDWPDEDLYDFDFPICPYYAIRA